MMAVALLWVLALPDAAAAVCPDNGRSRSFYDVHGGVVTYYSEVDRSRRAQIVSGADASSFELLERGPCVHGGYARDRNAVYYQGGRVQGAQPRSFQMIEDVYARDHAWWYGAGQRLARTSGGQLRILSSGYAIHPEGAFHGARRLDAEHFEVLGQRGYARSRSLVYFEGETIAGIDAASFSVFPDADWIARDKGTVVIKGKPDTRFDARSFAILSPYEGLVRDARHVYYDLQPVPGAEPATAKAMGRGYWRDTSSIYYRRNPIPGADVASFRLMPAVYGLDKNSVYVDGAPLPGRDPASFRYLGMAATGYTADRNSVYHRDRLVPGADAGTFVHVRGRYWKDKAGMYLDGRRVCAWTGDASLPVCDGLGYK